MDHGKEIENQNKDTVENWYEFNKILLRVFLIWLCFALTGCVIIPWNYYCYRTNEFIKGRGIVVENKFILNLTDGSKSIFPYRNRQNLYFSIYNSDVSDIYIEKIEIRTINGEKIYEKFIGEKLSDLQKKGETDIFNGKDLGARQNREILLEVVYYIKNGKITIPKNVRVIAVDPIVKDKIEIYPEYTINNHAPALDYGNPMFESIWRSYERSGSKYAK